MSIYIGNNLEDRLKALEMENELLRKYNDHHPVVHEIDHMSDLHVDSSFYKQSMKIDSYRKVAEWIDSSIGQSTVIQQLDKKRPALSNSNQTQNRTRYVNFENGSHFICSLNLNNPELTVCIAFRMNSIAPVNQLFFSSIIGNHNRNTAKSIAFYKTHSGLGLLISTAYNGSYMAVANDNSTLIDPDYKVVWYLACCPMLNLAQTCPNSDVSKAMVNINHIPSATYNHLNTLCKLLAIMEHLLSTLRMHRTCSSISRSNVIHPFP